MQILYSTGAEFSLGSCEYTSRPATGGEQLTRLFIPIEIENVRTDAVVDTGGAYLILNPELAAELEIDSNDALGVEKINIRGEVRSGSLHRLQVVFAASEGVGLPVEVTVFVPALFPGESWALPSFVGWHGCLERLRFALAPAEERFYFGSAD